MERRNPAGARLSGSGIRHRSHGNHRPPPSFFCVIFLFLFHIHEKGVVTVLRYKRQSALIVPLAIFVTAVSFLLRMGPVVTTTAITGNAGFRTVVLDAGHGGTDGGAVGRSGTQEKDLNLKIAKKTQEFMRFFGIPVVMTREDDRSLHSENAKTVKQQKTEDLKYRCDFTMAQQAPVYIAIHQNFYDDRVSRGAQVFYAESNAEGKVLAERMQNNLKTVLGQQNQRSAAKNPNKNYLLEHITYPAVIVECGFLSHPEEEMLLCSPDYQAKIAFALTMSAMDALANGLESGQ